MELGSALEDGRFVDYSLASDWEVFVQALEDVLRRWGWEDGAHGRGGDGGPLLEGDELAEVEFRGATWRLRLLCKVAYPSHPLLRWLGLDVVAVLSRTDVACDESDYGLGMSSSSDWLDAVEESDAKLLLSALALAVDGAAARLPVLVATGTPSSSAYLGYQFDGSRIARLRTEAVASVPERAQHLAGVLELFKSKLPARSSSSVIRTGGVGAGAAARPASVAGRTAVSCTVRFRWHLPLRDAAGDAADVWAGAEDSFIDVMHWRRMEGDGELIAVALQCDVAQTLQIREALQGSPSTPLWGPIRQPLAALDVQAEWKEFAEGDIVDNAVYSGLQPHAAQRWSVRPLWQPASLSSQTPLASSLRSLLNALRFVCEQEQPCLLPSLYPRRRLAKRSVAADAAVPAVRAAAVLGSALGSLTRSIVSAARGTAGLRGEKEDVIDADLLRSIMQEIFAGEGGEGGEGDRDDDGSDRSADELDSEAALREAAQRGRHPEVRRAFRASGADCTLQLPWLSRSAPTGSLLSLLVLRMADMCTAGGIAILWSAFVAELRWHWENAVPLPRMGWAPDGEPPLPDLGSSLLHQKLQLLNCCIQRRQAAWAEHGVRSAEDSKREDEDDEDGSGWDFEDSALDSAVAADLAAAAAGSKLPSSASLALPSEDELGDAGWGDDLDVDVDDDDDEDDDFDDDEFFDAVDEAAGEAEDALAHVFDAVDVDDSEAKTDGDAPLLLLRTGLPLTVPDTQQMEVVTEDMVLEQQRVLEQLGDSAEASAIRQQLQCASLLSDMRAFKACNDGAILADFVRWHSPRDWQADSSAEDGGRLSARMQSEDNIWQRLWRTATPLPASEQRPLFDATREAEKALHFLETMEARALFANLLRVAFSPIYFVLAAADSPAGQLSCVHSSLEQLRAAMAQASMLSADGSAQSLASTAAVAQLVQQTELLLARGTALCHKLQGKLELVEAALAEGEDAVMSKADELLLTMLCEQMGDDSDDSAFPPEDVREYELSLREAAPFHLPRTVAAEDRRAGLNRFYAHVSASGLRVGLQIVESEY